MADIRINALATTAASTASDDFIAVDGSANGTRKLDAYSPTFGGNLTVNGTGTQTLNGKLDVITAASSAANVDIAVLRQNYAGTAGHEGLISFTNISGTSVGKIGTRAVDGSNTSLVLRNFVSGSLADALTLSPSVATLSGNLTVSGTTIGLGGSTVPAWSSHNVLQTSDLASFGSFTGNKNAQVMHNAFWNGSAYKYIETAAASYYAQTAGVHSWFTAASGTAGNTITFAEAARITSGGNLLIGTTTDRGRLTINKTASDTLSTANAAAFIGQPDNLEAGLLMQQTATTPYSFVLQGRSPSGTYQFPISLNPQGGNVLIGTTTDGGQKLQVAGAIAATTGAANNALVARYNSSNSLFGVTVNSAGQGVVSENTDASTGSDKYSKTGLPAFRLGNTGGSGTVPFWIDVAASGTAGNAITWTNAFQIDNSQNATFAGTVIAGTWSSGTADKLKVSTAVNDYAAYFANIASSGGSYGIRLHTNTTGATDYLLVASSGAGSGSTRFIIKSNGTLNAPSLPTSSAGLSAGDIWNDGGTLKIV